jgi:hypothetical protein
LKAADCRFQAPDPNGIINNIAVNTDWEKYDPKKTTVIPCFNANIPVEEIKAYCKQKGILKFTIPLLVEKLYPAVGWHASFKNGWVDVFLLKI